jgi:putative spermidine/putrescine transport system permease protein
MTDVATSRSHTGTAWLRRAVVVAVVVAIGLPIAALVVWSLAFRWRYPDLLPEQWGTRAWAYVLDPSSRVLEGLRHSLVIAVIVTALANAIGLPAARALGMYEFRGKRFVEWLLLMPIIVPAIVATMGIHIMFLRWGLTGSYVGIALVHLIPALPYYVLVTASVFANYSTDLEDTARTLGAGRVQVFVRVTLPAIGPGLVVASMFTFLVSWSQYVTTLLIGGGRIITLPMVLFPFLTAGDNAGAAAISLVFVAPAIVVLVLTSRRLNTESSVMGGFGRL